MLSKNVNTESIAQNLIEELKKELKDYIKTASNETKKVIFNQYCESNGYYSDVVVDMDMLECYLPASPIDIVRMVEGSTFNSLDNYFSVNGYGNIYSYNCVENNRAFYLIDILEWLVDSGERTEKEEVNEILDDIEAIEELEKLTVEKVTEWDSVTKAATLSDGTEWKVLTDAEADKVAFEEIRHSLWAFNTDFILEHCKNITGYDTSDDDAEKAINLIQSNLCESCNDIIFLLIGGATGFEDFAIDAIDTDGRGHFIAWYDGVEHEAGNFYAYRID